MSNNSESKNSVYLTPTKQRRVENHHRNVVNRGECCICFEIKNVVKQCSGCKTSRICDECIEHMKNGFINFIARCPTCRTPSDELNPFCPAPSSFVNGISNDKCPPAPKRWSAPTRQLPTKRRSLLPLLNAVDN